MLKKIFLRRLATAQNALKGLSDKPQDISSSLKLRFGLNSASIQKLKQLTDMSEPAKVFPFTRAMKRKIICHLGPTNSGKTYAAIEELKKAAMEKDSSGSVYCAPLRLLAQEMYDKMNSAGIACSLRTGEISKLPINNKDDNDNDNDNEVDIYEKFDWNSASAVSCTVEMLNLRKMYSVAVIDEIQMIADPQRGWAFTQALLGCNAERLYLCGEIASRPLIEKILKETGESIEFVLFERLTPLELMPSALKYPIKYEPGDCVVTFSRKSIFKLKDDIEMQLNRNNKFSRDIKKVAVVYGSLPAENRAMQANKFNAEGSGVDILVASDAIGMGLNL
jgi:ATP-dependent RNA helicase SUPV3L1/SUV3